MLIHAMSRARSLRLKPNLTCALIAIEDPAQTYEEPTRDGWLGVQRFQYAPGTDACFQQGDAQSVLQAVRRWQARGVEDIVITDDSGQRASVAICTVLGEAGVAEKTRLWDAHNSLLADPDILGVMRLQVNYKGPVQATG